MQSITVVVAACLLCELLEVAATPIHYHEESQTSFHVVGGKKMGLQDSVINAVRIRLSYYPDFRESYDCAGVRISENTIVTLSECLHEYRKYKFERVTAFNGSGFEHLVYKRNPNTGLPSLPVLSHPNFDPDRSLRTFNIALVQDQFKAKPDKSLNARLPDSESEKDKNYIGKKAIITTFGQEGNQQQETYFYVTLNVTIVEPSECQVLYKSPPRKDTFFCVSTSPGTGLSKNDRGSPLMWRNEKTSQNKLLGLASSYQTEVSDGPQRILFEKIYPYAGWIREWSDVE